MTLLPRKLIHQIFRFPKYTLYLHRELICYHWQNKLDYHKKNLNNFDFVLLKNGSVNNCELIGKGISRSWKVEAVKKVMKSIFDCCASAAKWINCIQEIIPKVVEQRWLNTSLGLVRCLIPMGILFSRGSFYGPCDSYSCIILNGLKFLLKRSYKSLIIVNITVT